VGTLSPLRVSAAAPFFAQPVQSAASEHLSSLVASARADAATLPVTSKGDDLPVVDTQTTATLVRRAQRGDPDAIAALAGMFLRAAYLTALAIVTRPSDAEDVAQDAFVVALERIQDCREPARFAGWFLQIVRSRALNWLDRRRLRDVAADDERPERSGETVRMQAPGLKDQLLAALQELSVVQRQVVLLHDLEDWTHAEIAGVLDLSEVMSRQHLWNARRSLRVRLADHAPQEHKEHKEKSS
jgi:RNA polymerase sigma-70 factor (ECF subfamily)